MMMILVVLLRRLVLDWKHKSSFVFQDDVQTGTVLVELGPKSFAIILMPFYNNYYDVDDYFQAGTTLWNDHRSLHRPQQVQRTQC